MDKRRRRITFARPDLRRGRVDADGAVQGAFAALATRPDVQRHEAGRA